MPRDPIGTAGTVDAARQVSEDHMPETATVERWQDGGAFDPSDPGGSTAGWQTIHDGPESGRRDLLSDHGQDRTVARQFDVAEPLVAILPYGWDVAEGDRVTVGDLSMIVRLIQRATYSAHTRVIGVSEGSSEG